MGHFDPIGRHYRRNPQSHSGQTLRCRTRCDLRIGKRNDPARRPSPPHHPGSQLHNSFRLYIKFY